MTVQELLHNKYLAKMNNLTPKEWEEIKYIAKCEKKNPAEIVYRTIYFTWEDYKNFDSNDEFFHIYTFRGLRLTKDIHKYI